MASIAFPSFAKHYTVSTRHVYNYVHCPASNPVLPTILFLHGFPSSCYDWRHQIDFFREAGYGVIAPDLLGYGGTSKPMTLKSYRAKQMAAEIIELVNHEGLGRVHAVGQERGAMFLGRLANYFPDRLLSCTFLNTTYAPPARHFDLGAANRQTQQAAGNQWYGYLEFLARDDAGIIIDQHPESFSSLWYSQDPVVWFEHNGPTGALERWLHEDRRAPEAEYINGIERQVHQSILRFHGPPLKWYQALVRNINEQDEREARLDPRLLMPVMLVVTSPAQPDLLGYEAQMRWFAPNFILKRVSTQGRWVQLEARDEVNAILKTFFDSMLLRADQMYMLQHGAGDRHLQ
ncbi:Alpha/Beta hydrolase protein [Aspergillus unguis]